jgi:hypothetical protein
MIPLPPNRFCHPSLWGRDGHEGPTPLDPGRVFVVPAAVNRMVSGRLVSIGPDETRRRNWRVCANVTRGGNHNSERVRQ